jgi:hypothetical protein
MKDCYLLIDYVYLDSEERKRFAQASHEYLIEQLQFTGSETLTGFNNKYRLNFNHPSKYLIWVPHLDRYASRNQWIAHSAVDGSWVDAKATFAKVMVMGCCGAAAQQNGNWSVTIPKSALALPVPEGDFIGDLLSVAPVATGGVTAAMLAKVDVKFMCVADNDLSVTIGVGATQDAAWAAALDNAYVNRNELSLEDMSQTLAQLGANVAAFAANAVSVVDAFNYGNFVDGSDNPVYNAKIQLNGHDRFQALDGAYFNYVQPYQHFSNTPADGVNVYSFALKAEDHQPTGTCNFSRIDNATLQVDLGLHNAQAANYAQQYLGGNSNSLLNIYTVNYNVLRVMSGMAGTAYSN